MSTPRERFEQEILEVLDELLRETPPGPRRRALLNLAADPEQLFQAMEARAGAAMIDLLFKA